MNCHDRKSPVINLIGLFWGKKIHFGAKNGFYLNLNKQAVTPVWGKKVKNFQYLFILEKRFLKKKMIIRVFFFT
jgi:hypothetical protein